MGQRGPVPNHSDDLARDRSRKGADQQAVTKGISRPASIPEPDTEWHPIALLLWTSLIESGQTEFYQSSDWAFAYSVCEDLSLYKQSSYIGRGGRSGQMLQTIYSAMEALLVTEGARRRVRIELAEPDSGDESAAVLAIAEYEQELEATEDEATEEN